MKTKATIKHIAKFCFVLGTAFYANTVQAASINRNDIIPSTTLPVLGQQFTIDQINDGITTNFPFNGFGSTESNGTISFNFVKEFDLNSFVLWNDINVQQEGIKDFRLDFFDKSNALINASSILQGPLGQIEPKEYTFDKVIPGVSRVDLVVLNSYESLNRIEIREVGFTGTPSATSVPEPSSVLALSAFLGFGILLSKKRCKQLS